jgi:hypothetical protein
MNKISTIYLVLIVVSFLSLSQAFSEVDEHYKFKDKSFTTKITVTERNFDTQYQFSDINNGIYDSIEDKMLRFTTTFKYINNSGNWNASAFIGYFNYLNPVSWITNFRFRTYYVQGSNHKTLGSVKSNFYNSKLMSIKDHDKRTIAYTKVNSHDNTYTFLSNEDNPMVFAKLVKTGKNQWVLNVTKNNSVDARLIKFTSTLIIKRNRIEQKKIDKKRAKLQSKLKSLEETYITL